MKMNVAVIGAGIKGLSVAVNLLETIPGINVRIFAEKTTPNTTGDISAGMWFPYAVSENDSRLKNWCSVTYNYLSKIMATDPNHHKYGILSIYVYELGENQNLKLTPIHEIFDSVRILNERELKRFPLAKSGLGYFTFITEASKFLPFLLNKFKSLGGHVVMESVSNFDEVQTKKNYPIIINCTGLGSHDLCNDSSIYPLRGQVVRVKAPWIKFVVLNETHYIIPQSDGVVVLGGTKQANDWSILPNDDDTKYILEGCEKLLHGIKNPDILSVDVGLRPRRTDVRLEMEDKTNSSTGARYKLIHNYGHGGSGFSLFWGCSVDVVRMVSDLNAAGNL